MLAAGLACGCEPWQPARREVVSPLRRVRRLSSREYDNVVRDLLGDTSLPATHFLADVYPNGYDNGSAGLAVQSDQVLTYQSAAETLAASAVAERLPQLLGGCYPQIAGPDACFEMFLDGFAARAWRRPLTLAEADRLRALAGAEQAAGGSFADGIQASVEVILQSPQFLYREETGGPGAPPGGRSVVLSDWEMASQLSFMLTGSIPDDTLWSAVQAGRFHTAADRRREALRLLASPAAQATLHAFFHQWLGTERLALLTKDARYYPTFSPALAVSMSTELDGFFDLVLGAQGGSLRQLFTSDRSVVDRPLASLYGIAPPASPFGPVRLDPNVRKGVLTRAGYLAVHANTDSSGPITRGVFLLSAILCAPPPDPPANVPAPRPIDDPSVKGFTTRQRFAEHAQDPACASCHRQIDGVGFGFEEFDAIGAYRTTENGHPIDASGELIGTRDDGRFDGVAQLADRLSRSPEVAVCFVRQVYRFGMGELEFSDDSIAWLGAGFTTDSPLTDPLLALIASSAFEARRYEGAP